jgi:hypothetical protein
MQRDLAAGIDTSCACCGQELRLTVRSDLSYEVRSDGATPVLSVPFINFEKLKDPSIIHAF